MARVFASDDIGLAQGLQRTQRDIAKVADWGGNDGQ